ncbi:MAG TPA: helix-turn-helix domain-containing protein [Herpetosiphonaceae bacterium]
MLEAWLTATEAAEYLDVSRSTINNMTKQIDPVTGKHYGTRRGALWLFTREELDRWKVTPRHAGGRPKPETALMTPVMAV